MAKNKKQTESTTKSTYERFASHLVSVVLGALVLWVGQTTFKHNGELSGIRQQIESLEKGQNEITREVASRTEGRFTKEDGFRMENSLLVQTSAGAPGSTTNRVSSAEAVSWFIDSEIRTGNWIFTPGVRFEDIEAGSVVGLN